HDNGSDAADDRNTQLIGVGAERDDDERNLETFENDRLEGEDEGRPVEPGTGPLEWLVSGGEAEAGQAVRRDSNHALPEPLQPEDEKEGADDQPERSDRNPA